MDVKTLKAAVRDQFSAMEKAAADLEAVEPDADEAGSDELVAAFNDAERAHQTAVEKLERAEKLESARGALPVVPAEETVEVPEARIQVGKSELVYRSDFQGPSFFRDALDATKGNSAAGERLAAHNKQIGEERALSSSDTAGGEFIPPAWLLDQYVDFARASRPVANAVNRLPLPAGTDSINLPAVTTGTTTGAQADGGNVGSLSSDAVTATVTASVITIAGQQDLSRQAFERSAAAGTGLEQVLGADLAADYAKQIDIQVLRGSGSSGQALGLVNVSSPNTVSYTTSSPVVAGSSTAADNLYPKIGNAIQQIHTNRFLPPTAIIMHPRRFAWMMSASDTQGRPLVVPVAQATNTIGLLERVGSENVVGSIQGVPVIVDANIATNTGASTNQDTIIVTRLEDQWLWEDTPKVRVFEEVLSNTGQIRIQLFAYAAFTGSRYAKATSLITGTGLVTPTF